MDYNKSGVMPENSQIQDGYQHEISTMQEWNILGKTKPSY